MNPGKQTTIHAAPAEIFLPKLSSRFDPWDHFCNENEYKIDDKFLEYVLKCTSLPPNMPAMSLLNYSIQMPTTPARLLKKNSGNFLITDPLEICRAAAYLTEEGLINMEGKNTIIGYLHYYSLAVTARQCSIFRKWVFKCLPIYSQKMPVDFIVKAPKILDIALRKN